MKTLLLLSVLVLVSCASASRILRAVSGERAGNCPADSGLAGICVFIPDVNCLSDSECAEGKKCCHEGCGKVCKDIVSATTAVHRGSCPAIEPGHEFGICMLLPNACSDDSQCLITEKCCPEGCNRVCKNAVQTIG